MNNTVPTSSLATTNQPATKKSVIKIITLAGKQHGELGGVSPKMTKVSTPVFINIIYIYNTQLYINNNNNRYI